MRFDPKTIDIHPRRCDCGLCESVENASWIKTLAILRDAVLFILVLAAGCLFIVAQVVVECNKCFFE